MSNMDKYQALAKLVEEGTAAELFADDFDETLRNLNAAGLDFTRQELENLVAAYISSQSEGELDVADLESVAGGAFKASDLFKGIRPGDVFRKGVNNWFNKYTNNLIKTTRGKY